MAWLHCGVELNTIASSLAYIVCTDCVVVSKVHLL